MTEDATKNPPSEAWTGHPTAMSFAQNFAVRLAFRQKSFEHFLIPQ
jgi:hypothetical protein